MTRIYHQLECGCLVSCDGGGGLIPCDSPNCKADEWIEKHMQCPICDECLICYDHQKCIHIWNKEHAYRNGSVFTKKLINIGLSFAQIVQVISAIETTCNYCWDGERTCSCMRDD